MIDTKKLEEEFKSLPEGWIILLETSAEKSFETGLASIQILTGKNYNGIIISASRPYANLVSIYQNNNIDTKKIFILDCISKSQNADVKADKSILSVPLTAAVLPLAWLAGSDIHVRSIDKTFKESMDELKIIFRNMFPKVSFKAEIIADEVVENFTEVSEIERITGMMFSGGVDSVYTLISNFHLRPKLVMLWGVDNFPYPERKDHWEKTISTYTEYAERKNLDFPLILLFNLGSAFSIFFISSPSLTFENFFAGWSSISIVFLAGI